MPSRTILPHTGATRALLLPRVSLRCTDRSFATLWTRARRSRISAIYFGLVARRALPLSPGFAKIIQGPQAFQTVWTVSGLLFWFNRQERPFRVSILRCAVAQAANPRGSWRGPRAPRGKACLGLNQPLHLLCEGLRHRDFGPNPRLGDGEGRSELVN